MPLTALRFFRLLMVLSGNQILRYFSLALAIKWSRNVEPSPLLAHSLLHCVPSCCCLLRASPLYCRRRRRFGSPSSDFLPLWLLSSLYAPSLHRFSCIRRSSALLRSTSPSPSVAMPRSSWSLTSLHRCELPPAPSFSHSLLLALLAHLRTVVVSFSINICRACAHSCRRNSLRRAVLLLRCSPTSCPNSESTPCSATNVILKKVRIKS
jgi:hypothetical protein